MDLPPELPMTNVTLTAQCYCKSVHFTITLQSSALPLPVHLCHCHICRYTHGTPCIFHAPLPDGVSPEFIAPSSLEGSLTGYVHSEQPRAASTRFFCSTCGCHVGDRDRDLPDPERESESGTGGGHLEWRVATSIFSLPNSASSQTGGGGGDWSSIFQIRSHVFANDNSSPNGIYNWLPCIDSRPLNIWNPPANNSVEFPIPRPSQIPEKQFNEHGEEVLLAQCHCAGVSFSIPRPSAVLSNPQLPEGWKEVVRSYLPPSTQTGEKDNWAALLDLCDDCRLVDGTHVIGWTFVPLDELRPGINADLKHGTIKTFKSSGNVTRGFCSVCGATVFFLNRERAWHPTRACTTGNESLSLSDKGQEEDEGKTGNEEVEKEKVKEKEEDEQEYIMVDIATGILRAPGGVAAEDWLTWRTGRVGWYASGERYDASFARSLARGFADWGVRTHGEAVDFTIAD